MKEGEMVGSGFTRSETALVGDKPWGLYEREDSAQYHVVPEKDLKRHFFEDCWCRPAVEGMIYVHNALDRRELYEAYEN